MMKSSAFQSGRNRLLLLIALLGLGLIIVFAFALAGSQNFTVETPRVSGESLIPVVDPVKLIIAHDGIYKVDLKTLESLGLDMSKAGLADLELASLGKSQPYWIDRRRGMMYFFGRGIDSRYSRENVYLLGPKWETPDGSEIAQPESDGGQFTGEDKSAMVLLDEAPGDSYAALTYLEENQVYSPLVEDGDHWFWESLLAPQKKSFDVDLNESLPGPGNIRLMLWGRTEASISPDHHLIIRVNGHQVADESWDGKGRRLVRADIPASLMQKGRIQVEIELPGDTGTAADILFVDWIEVVYPRRYQAEDDRLNFISRGGKIKMQGFTGPVDIFDVTEPGLASRVGQAITAEDGYDSIAGHSYWVVGPRGTLDPLRIENALVTPDLRSDNNRADYLAVGPPELLKPLYPLLERREQQGLTTMALPIQAIYDQFNFGLTDPQAIRTVLAYAQENWVTAPKYLLLVGDASFDPKGYQAPAEANQVPTFFIQTLRGGETASDYGFSVPGSTPWPATGNGRSELAEVAVGRLPARNPIQVTDFVNKVISYEETASQFDPDIPWQKQILAIVDGTESSFQTDAENLLRKVPDSYETELLVPQSGDQDYSQVIQDRLDQGSWFVVYFGHGSINMWGKDKIFTRQDVTKLRNHDRLPIMLHLTCLTGLFTHPKEESLAEAFLWQPNGGAIAVLAPTSLTLQEDQSYLSYAIEAEFVKDLDARLGDVLLHAQKTIPGDNPGAQEVLRTFLLFGDPALRIARFPK